MGLSEAEIEERLAQLRRERDALDRAIADHVLYLELGRRLGGAFAETDAPLRQALRPQESRAQESPSQERLREALRERPQDPPIPSTPVRADSVASGPVPVAFTQDPVGARRYGRALIEAACGVLVRAGRPMHAREILEALMRAGFTVPGQDPVAALNTRLWKRSGPDGPLRRLGDAVYAPAVTDRP